MSKQFVKGNVYVFTKKKFLKERCKTQLKSSVNSNHGWPNKINGNEITMTGHYTGDAKEMLIVPEWCKCIKNNNPKIESEAI